MSTPLISVVTPVYNVPIDVFRDTARSVLDQTFTDWEWILVDDRSPDENVLHALRRVAEEDDRVRVIERPVNGGIVAASNDGIDAARGEFIALLDHDDLLVPEALTSVAEALALHDDIDYLYSDESIVEDGVVLATFHKPDWSPERLRHQMYTSHLSVMRTELVRSVGAFRPGYDGSQDHDLVLRLTEHARRVWHIPHVLYHWRVVPGSTADGSDPDAKPYAWIAGAKAVQDHLDRTGLHAVAELGASRGYFSLHRELDPHASISVVIPTRGTAGRVRGAERYYVVEIIRSLIEKSLSDDIEYVVVYDLDTPAAVLEELGSIAGDALVLVPFSEPFNFSRKCNVGFLRASKENIVFLNDDMEAFSQHPLEELVAPLSEPGVGMTGARLLFENTTHQHAGIVYGSGTIYPGHYRLARDHPGHFGALWVSREVSALTGACLALRRDTFESVGGFSEAFSLNYNDIDLSFKVRRLGLRLVWLQNVELFHFESVSRETRVEEWELDLVRARWGALAQRERYMQI
jgi:GT2 family glycosyltransferase